jgi:hypothetical protein
VLKEPPELRIGQLGGDALEHRTCFRRFSPGLVAPPAAVEDAAEGQGAAPAGGRRADGRGLRLCIAQDRERFHGPAEQRERFSLDAPGLRHEHAHLRDECGHAPGRRERVLRAPGAQSELRLGDQRAQRVLDAAARLGDRLGQVPRGRFIVAGLQEVLPEIAERVGRPERRPELACRLVPS